MVRLKRWLKKLWSILTWPYRKIKQEIEFRKKLKEIQKKDPFIYK